MVWVILDSFNPATGTGHTPDANLGIGFAGLTSPTGSLVVQQYAGGYITVTTGEEYRRPAWDRDGKPRQHRVHQRSDQRNLHGLRHYRLPGGGTAAGPNFFVTTFQTFDNNANFRMPQRL